MKLAISLSLALLIPTLIAGSLPADDAHLGGMRLLPGYKHQPLQGIDSIVGEIKKAGGLRIQYEIGAVVKPGAPRFGGSFSDRPKQMPKDKLHWYHEQVVNGQPMHAAYGKDNLLMVSFPKKGVNLTTTVRNANEMAEAMLMIMTYPNPPAGKKVARN